VTSVTVASVVVAVFAGLYQRGACIIEYLRSVLSNVGLMSTFTSKPDLMAVQFK